MGLMSSPRMLRSMGAPSIQSTPESNSGGDMGVQSIPEPMSSGDSSSSSSASSYFSMVEESYSAPPLRGAPKRGPVAPDPEEYTGEEYVTEMHVSADYDENSSISYNKVINLDLTDFDCSDVESAMATLYKIQNLMSEVMQKQSYVGTMMTRLESVTSSQLTKIENLSAAKSTIMDTDIAKETANLVKAQILQKTTIAVLTQTRNMNSATALKILGGISNINNWKRK